MSNFEPPSPAVRCPRCQAVQIVQTQRSLTRIFYFCLACGKSFERTEKWKGSGV